MFLITPGQIEELADLLTDPLRPADLLGTILTAADTRPPSLDRAGVERIGIVAHHLFWPKRSSGVFIPLTDISEAAVLKAYRDLLKQKREETVDGEGVVKELQAM